MIRKIVSPQELPPDSWPIGIGPVTGELYYDDSEWICKGTEQLFKRPFKAFQIRAHITKGEELLIVFNGLLTYDIKNKRVMSVNTDMCVLGCLDDKTILVAQCTYPNNIISVVQLHNDGTIGNILKVPGARSTLSHVCKDIPFFCIKHEGGKVIDVYRFDQAIDSVPTLVRTYTFCKWVNICYMGQGIFRFFWYKKEEWYSTMWEFCIFDDNQCTDLSLEDTKLALAPFSDAGVRSADPVPFHQNPIYTDYYKKNICEILNSRNPGYFTVLQENVLMFPSKPGPMHFFKLRKCVGSRISLRSHGKNHG